MKVKSNTKSLGSAKVQPATAIAVATGLSRARLDECKVEALEVVALGIPRKGDGTYGYVWAIKAGDGRFTAIGLSETFNTVHEALVGGRDVNPDAKLDTEKVRELMLADAMSRIDAAMDKLTGDTVKIA